MNVSENRLQQSRQVALEIARKQKLLRSELFQCPPYPQERDIFIFDYPNTVELQWVILRCEENPQFFFTVPADNNPIVGSADIELPNRALCSPLTLRCRYSLLISKDKFDIKLRVGLLENWHWQRALDKIKQISDGKIRSSVRQREMDNDLDYEDWMEQVKQEWEICKEILGSPLSQQDLSRSQIPMNLGLWLKNNFVEAIKTGWQEVETFGIEDILVGNYRSKPVFTTHCVKRAKQINLGESHQIILVIQLGMSENKTIKIHIQTYPTNVQADLPENLQLTLFSDSGEVLDEVRIQKNQNCALQELEGGLPGDQFNMKIALENVIVTEYFIL